MNELFEVVNEVEWFVELDWLGGKIFCLGVINLVVIDEYKF